MRVYHGLDVEIVEIDLSKSLMNKDFSKGLYVSDEFWQARDFANYKADKPRSKTKTEKGICTRLIVPWMIMI